MTPDHIASWLRARVADLAGITADEVDDELELHAYGIDSAQAASLAGDLHDELGLEVDVDILYAHPTIGSLAPVLAGAPRAVASPSPSAPPRPPRVATRDEPIAVVGASCRFPGAPDLPSFWRLLVEGRCAVGDVPTDRWDVTRWWADDPGRPGRSVSSQGGFVDEIDGLDQELFGIAAAEAARMDPQQRMLLEVAWDALEDAGAPARSLRGSATGVYVGVSVGEYGGWQLQDPPSIDGLVATGGALSIVANRLSYLLDLRGPSVAVDTACSSSLTAVHLARGALLAGECDVAIAGGVNAVLAPEIGVSMSKAGVLSPDGICKSFSEDADGYVRSEGAAAVVLKRLTDAVLAGDRILAVVRGSAVNQDGRSNGLAAPNPEAQTSVVRAALRSAGIEPEAVGYVETHGSATAMGDRIEAAALGAAVRPGGGTADAEPCVVGSVKSNLGHLESAAGIAGLLKAVLSVHHGVIPASLHVSRPNPAIDFAGLGLSVAQEARAWEQPVDCRVAGVSSFGFGGTNAHVVLAGHEAMTAPGDGGAGEDDAGGDVLLLLSAAGEAGLGAVARRWADWLTADSPAVGDILATAAGRTRHDHRLGVVGSTSGELAAELRRRAEGPLPAATRDPRVGFVFSGQGPSWDGRAVELCATQPLFASVVRRVDEIGQELGRPSGWLADPVRGLRPAPVTDQSWMQPAWFAVQVGLAALWRAARVRPTLLLGHSLGEVAAAHVAGCIDLATAARIACVRGEAAAELMSARGGLVATDLGEAEAREVLARAGDALTIAASNSPTSTAFAGTDEVLAELVERLQAEGRFAQRLALAPPSHSPLAADAAERLGRALADIEAGPARLPLLSSVTAEPLNGSSTDGAYWRDNLRGRVRFAEAAAQLLEHVDVVVELAPQPTIARAVGEVAAAARRDVVVVSSGDRTGPSRAGLLAAAGALVETGVEVAVPRLQEVPGRRLIAPGYAWQRTRAWNDPRGARSPEPSGHELVGAEVAVAALPDHTIHQARLRRDTLTTTLDHRVAGEVVVPAAGIVDALAEAGRRSAGVGDTVELADVRFERFLPVPAGAEPVVQTAVRPGEPHTGTARVELHSRLGAGATWRRHARAELRAGDPVEGPGWDDLAILTNQPVDTAMLYEAFAGQGVEYGPAHRPLRQVRRGDGVAVGALDPRGVGWAVVDPTSLDGAFQLLAAAAATTSGPGGDTRLHVPAAARRIRLRAGAVAEQAAVRITRDAATGIEAEVWLYGADGAVVASVEGLVVRRVAAATARPDAAGAWGYEVAWRARALGTGAGTAPAPRRWLLLADDGPAAEALAGGLREAGAPEVVVAKVLDDGLVSVGGVRRDLDEMIAEAGDQPSGVVLVAGDGTAEDQGRRGSRLARGALHVIRAASFAPVATPPRLVFLTSGPGDPAGAVLRGLARVVPFENPLLDCRLLDAGSGTPSPATRDALVDELVRGEDADVAVRDASRLVARLVPVEPFDPLDATNLHLDAEGAYVITGGLGGIGLGLARYLVAQGARRLALLGRSEPGPAATAALEALRADAEVEVVAVDVGDAAALRHALTRVRSVLGPLRGVAHAAGVLLDRAMLDLRGDELEAVLRPKVAGGWNLHRAVDGDELDWFVCFSSASGVIGSPGQAAYCAANAFLDALVEHRRSASGSPRSTAIAWGPWAGIGVVSGRVGESPGPALAAGLDPDLAFAAFGALAVEQPAQRVILPYDLGDLLSYHPGGASLAFFEEILHDRRDLATTFGARTSLRRRPRLDHDVVAPTTDVERRIVAMWQAALGIEQIGVTDGFFELGGDSVLANQVFMNVSREFGVSVDIEAAFLEATVAHLATLVVEALERPGGAPSPTTSQCILDQVGGER